MDELTKQPWLCRVLGWHKWAFERNHHVDLPGLCTMFPIYKCTRPGCNEREMRDHGRR